IGVDVTYDATIPDTVGTPTGPPDILYIDETAIGATWNSLNLSCYDPPLIYTPYAVGVTPDFATAPTKLMAVVTTMASLEDFGDATAEWAINEADPRGYSAKLHAGFAAGDWAEVVLTPPAGITLADMATISSGWSWWYYIVSAAGNRGTSLELHFESVGADPGYAEMTIMDDAYGAFPAGPVVIGSWTEQTIVSDTTTGLIFGTDTAGNPIAEFPVGVEGTIFALATHVIGVDGNAADWVLTEVRPALGWIGLGETIAYIDDVT
ncbi:unnamed protein product, partial [marine sediment metagenome]